MRSHSCHLHAHCGRRAFTLMESLMACGVLLVIIVAVSAAIAAGQQHSMEARQRIAATLAADDLLGRLVAKPYNELPAWNGYTEAPGSMTDASGAPLPNNFALVGRQVSVEAVQKILTDTGVIVNGRQVSVRAFDSQNRTLSTLARFVSEPQA